MPDTCTCGADRAASPPVPAQAPQRLDDRCLNRYLPDALACTREPHTDPWHSDGLGNQWGGPSDDDPTDGIPALTGAGDGLEDPEAYRDDDRDAADLP